MRRTLASTILLATLYALPALAQQSTREDFKEFAKTMTGRWVVDATLITDWPGIGKRGDKVTGYNEVNLTEDGNAILTRSFGGTGSGTWLTVYDAAAKQIRESGVDSGGTVWTSIYSKAGDKWTVIQTGSLADGSTIEGKYTVTISDNGKTQTWTGPTTIGGKKVDDLHDVCRRVSR